MVNKITKYKIIRLFLNDYSKKYYLREMANLLEKPHQTIKPYVEQLTKENILIKTQRKNITEFGLNNKNKQTYDYIIIAEKEKFISRLNKDELIKTLFEKISDFLEDNIFILFGSTVEKTQKQSDIDLIVVGKSNLTKTLKNFEETYNKKVHKIQVSNFKEINSALTKEIYKKHIIFNKTEEVIKFLEKLYEQNKLV